MHTTGALRVVYIVETKKCGSCKQFLLLDLFGKNANRPDGLQVYCKPCRKLVQSSWYYKHGGFSNPKRIANKNAFLERNRTFLVDFLKNHPCVDCGETNILFLQFDHQGDKVANVSYLMTSASVENLSREIDKCEVVCAHCHILRTARTFQWWKLDLPS